MPDQRQAQLGNQWNDVETTAGASHTVPTRQHPELGEAHRARMNYQSDLSIGAAGDRLPTRKFLYATKVTSKDIFTPQNAIKKLAI